MIARTLAVLRRLERLAAAALLVALVAVVFLGAAGRYGGRPVLWSDEVAQGLFVWLSLLAADLTLQRRGHFAIDLLAGLLPARARLALELCVTLLVAALLLLLFASAVSFAEMTAGRPLPMTMVPSSVATSALPVGFALMLVTLAEQLAARLRAGPGEAP